MREIYFLISVTLLMLVGCSNDSLHFKGESDHWKGSGGIDGQTIALGIENGYVKDSAIYVPGKNIG